MYALLIHAKENSTFPAKMRNEKISGFEILQITVKLAIYSFDTIRES
jgi:hypothetical protein